MDSTTTIRPDGDSFENFTSLILLLSQRNSPYTPSHRFQSYLQTLPNPLPPNSTSHTFNLLYPHVSPRRRYGMQETKLASVISDVLGFGEGSLYRKALMDWNTGERSGIGGGGVGNQNTPMMGKRGFLGDEVRKVLEIREGVSEGDHQGWMLATEERRRRWLETRGGRGVTIGEVNGLLDQLASWSKWSQIEPPIQPTLTPHQILTRLYLHSHLSPLSLSLLTQIILRDLRPILDPLLPSSLHPTTALLDHKSNEVKQLDLKEAMMEWDWEMWLLWQGCGDFEVIGEERDRRGGGAGRRNRPGPSRLDLRLEPRMDGYEMGGSTKRQPRLHVNVPIPKCEKGRSIDSALKMAVGGKNARMRREDAIWAETKYDGFRMQIHVEVQRDESPKISIFSKSKRNSTNDRLSTHPIILASLGLPFHHLSHHPKLHDRTSCSASSTNTATVQSVILEAEMAPYNEVNREGNRGPGIEEFWNLSSNMGPGLAVVETRGTGEEEDEARWIVEGSDRHLCICYFDILFLNGKSMLDVDYDMRRATMESIVKIIDGFSQCAKRRKIGLINGYAASLQHIEDTFAQECLEKHEEGLVLKHSRSVYNDPRYRWIKLKRDYIPGIGDCVDLVVIGAGWDRDRARELKVGTSAYTSLYIAVWTNKHLPREKQHFQLLFTSSYGLSRTELEELNNQIRHRSIANRPYVAPAKPKWGRRMYARERMPGLDFDFTLRRDIPPPAVIFDEPRVAELMGAGFQKLPGSNLHELRWPRTVKVFPLNERSWMEALDAQTYRKACSDALGHLRIAGTRLKSDSDAILDVEVPPDQDSLDALWESSSAGGLDLPDNLGLVSSPERSIPASKIKREGLCDVTTKVINAQSISCTECAPAPPTRSKRKLRSIDSQKVAKPRILARRPANDSFFDCLTVWFAGDASRPPAGKLYAPEDLVPRHAVRRSLSHFLSIAVRGTQACKRGSRIRLILVDLAENSLAEVTEHLERSPCGREQDQIAPVIIADVHWLYNTTLGKTRSSLQRWTLATWPLPPSSVATL